MIRVIDAAALEGDFVFSWMVLRACNFFTSDHGGVMVQEPSALLVSDYAVLETLDLSFNHISSVDQLPQLSSLQTLSLQG